MAQSSESGTDKLLIAAASIVAGAVAQRVVKLTWRAVRGPEPSKDDDSPLGDVILFAAISAATVATARTWAARRARQRRILDKPGQLLSKT
jgi:hypothetical protein